MSEVIIADLAINAVMQYLYQILLIIAAMIKTHGFGFVHTNLAIAMLLLVSVVLAVSLSDGFNAQAATSKNSTISSTGNTTRGLASTNNVTTSAGNNGHIYRGGAATGSGGE